MPRRDVCRDSSTARVGLVVVWLLLVMGKRGLGRALFGLTETTSRPSDYQRVSLDELKKPENRVPLQLFHGELVGRRYHTKRNRFTNCHFFFMFFLGGWTGVIGSGGIWATSNVWKHKQETVTGLRRCK